MAIRAEHLQQDDLLARYLSATQRHRSGLRANHQDDLLLARYLKALERHPVPLDARTCSHCGRHAGFTQDVGGWGVCSACGVTA